MHWSLLGTDNQEYITNMSVVSIGTESCRPFLTTAEVEASMCCINSHPTKMTTLPLCQKNNKTH